jgi:outer membrane immunogenic protein
VLGCKWTDATPRGLQMNKKLKKLLLASTAVSGLVLAGPALAADLPLKAPPIIAVPAFSWTGCYIGGNVGGARGQKEWDNFSGSLFSDLFGGAPITVITGTATFSESVSFSNTSTETTAHTASVSFFPDNQTFTNSHAVPVHSGTETQSFSFSVSPLQGNGNANRITSISDDTAGFLAGGQVGCDLQFAPRWVIGIEGDGEWAHITGTTDVAFSNPAVTLFGADGFTTTFPAGVIPGMFASAHTLTEWLASVTVRLGYTPWDRWLIYWKGGAAWAGDKYTLSGSACEVIITAPTRCFESTPFDFRGSETRFGWTTGLGIEYAFANYWSAKLEWDYYDFGTRHVTFTDQLGHFEPGGADINQRINVIKFGVNYRFNWLLGKAPPALPVAARY